jgi:hypothetical protein
MDASPVPLGISLRFRKLRCDTGCADWGEVDAHDKAENEYSLQHGFRLLSTYRLADGTKIWVITEADRSSTTILLPEEY